MLNSLIAAITIVTNVGFTVAYDTNWRNPSWVSYDLEPCEVIRMKRVPHDFKPDPRIKETDVRGFFKAHGHVYDRGHLAPAADFNWNTNALNATYYFSNISPMTRKLNRGKWLDAENEVRRLAESGTVHVVMFPLYDGITMYHCPTNANDCFIPTKFVKVAWGWFGVRKWELENKE